MIVTERNSTTKALRRIRQILDSGSFMEIGEHITARLTDFYTPEKVEASDGVITGYGTIGGHLVYVFSQDGEVMGGSFGEMHGRKINRLYRLAIKAKAPVIGFLDSSGLRVEEGLDSLDVFGQLYALEAEASRQILQIMAICGNCSGGMTVVADMADIVLSDSEHLSDQIRTLIDLLPANASQYPEQGPCSDDLNRQLSGLEKKRGDGREILRALSDMNFFFELKQSCGRDMIIGFMRLNGTAVGGIATQAIDSGGKISPEGFEKAAAFIDLCGKLHIPLLTVTDAKRFEGSQQAGRLVKALTAASVPKINLIAGEILGSGYSILNSKGVGADYVFMWDCGAVSLIDPLQAAEILYSQAELEFLQKRAEDYRKTHCSPMALARHGYVDKIIKPEDSRKFILGAFETFANAREVRQ